MFPIFGKNWSEARRRPYSGIRYTNVNFFLLFQIKLSSATGRRHDVGELAVKCSQHLAKTAQMLTGGPMADTVYSFLQCGQSCRRHDVAELAVKCSQVLAKTGQRLTGGPIVDAAYFFTI